MSVNFDIHERIRRLEIQQRNRVVMRSRLKRGLLTLVHKPWTLIFPLLLITLSVIVCHNLDKVLFPGSTIPELVFLWEITIVCLVILLTVFLLCGFLIALGTPAKAKRTEAALVHIGFTDRYGVAPALIVNQAVKGSVRRLTFYSKGIGQEVWLNRQRDIEDVLNFHCVEPIEFDRDRHSIVLIVAPGVQTARDESLYDDEL